MARKPKAWFYRRTGCWTAWVNGERVQLAEGKPNKRAAERRLQEILAEAVLNPPSEASDQTVASVIEAYLEHATKRLASTTQATRRLYLQSFAELHGFRKVSDCKRLHVVAWIDKHPKWKSDWTVHCAVSTIQRPFNWATEIGLITRNPFKGEWRRQGAARRPVTAEEFQALLRATNGRIGRHRPSPGARFRELLIFLARTGCRPCEARQLRWSDVDAEHAVLVLTEHKTIRTQRTPRPRIVPLDQVVMKLLEHIRERDEGERVFLNYRGTPWTKDALVLRLQRARKLAGVPKEAKLYGIRHAFGTRGIVNGCDIKTLATLMGHTSTRMTEHYLHLAGEREHLASAMRRVNGQRPGA